MILSTWRALTEGRTPRACNAQCLVQANACREAETRAYQSYSGTDVAEAPKHGLAADLYCLLGAGADRDAALAWATAAWTQYAAEQRARVNAAPRIKRGPRAGNSVIAHRWVSDDMSWAHHVLRMVDIWSERGNA